MSFLVRVLLSLAVFLLMFEGMVTAFHSMNLPSNLTVWAGLCLLLLVAVGGFALLWKIWVPRR